jgi:hypothetical protein
MTRRTQTTSGIDCLLHGLKHKDIRISAACLNHIEPDWAGIPPKSLRERLAVGLAFGN